MSHEQRNRFYPADAPLDPSNEMVDATLTQHATDLAAENQHDMQIALTETKDTDMDYIDMLNALETTRDALLEDA